jgi:glycopeptide antibiotics resistance protein
MRKILSRGLLLTYVLLLIWLVLFKMGIHPLSRFSHQHRSLNLVPFAAPSRVNGHINYMEMVYNVVFFIPLGLLLDVNFKKTGFLPKLLFVMCFSVAAETLQYIFAIGASDITDVITNTLGGFLGLTLYQLSNKFIRTEKLDGIILAIGFVLLFVFISIDFVHFGRSHRVPIASQARSAPQVMPFPGGILISVECIALL